MIWTHRHQRTAALGCLLGGLLWGAAAAAAPLPHGPQTRDAFLAAKSVPSAKNGELGDAAVTSDRYDVLRNEIDLRIDPATASVSGSVRMVFQAGGAGLDAFVFDMGAALDLVAVEHLSGELPATRGGDTVVVALPTALAPGAVDSVLVRYTGDDTTPVANRGLMFKTHFPLPPIPQENLVPLVANLSQPAFAQHWWPCKDRPDDKFLMTMRVTVPDTLFAVSNGVLVSDAPAAPGWRTLTWRESHPIATYLVSVAVSDYVRLVSPCTTPGGSSISLENFVLPRDVDNALVDFAPLCDMIGFCEDIYAPYPFPGEKYGHAVFIWPGAMEHQTVTSIGTVFVSGTGDSDWLIMHELAHQWFGDSLTPADWADIWLNEGFATYAEALWFEHLGGAADYATYMANARHESEWLAQGPVYDPVPVFPGRVIYDKGAWIVHMLRERMGDAAFFAFLADWTGGGGRPRDHVATADLVALASSHAGEDLAAFLWPYLTSTALPVLDVAWRVVAGDAGPDTRLELDLAQRQTPLFDNVYPLRVTTTAGVVDLTAPLATAAATLTFELAAPVTGVALDPERRLLWNPAGATSTPAGLTAAFPNPTRGGYIVFGFRLRSGARPQLRVYDARGRELASRDLGAYPAGDHEYGYDVTGKQGERLPSGVYWAALTVDGQRSVKRFTVVR